LVAFDLARPIEMEVMEVLMVPVEEDLAWHLVITA
jgi:hypothetical protein